MTTRAFLAAILGGIAMFIWSFIAHDLLPLGEIGMREFKNESAVLDALKTNLGDARGLYHFPGHRAGPNATRQEKSDAMKRAMEKAASGPSTTNIPYWNWYGFPSNYTAAYMSIEIIGFLCVGLVAGLLLKNRSPASATS